MISTERMLELRRIADLIQTSKEQRHKERLTILKAREAIRQNKQAKETAAWQAFMGRRNQLRANYQRTN